MSNAVNGPSTSTRYSLTITFPDANGADFDYVISSFEGNESQILSFAKSLREIISEDCQVNLTKTISIVTTETVDLLVENPEFTIGE
jgi:hypothetical protein